ncbi:MAG: ribonuclease HI family protein [Dehalococcoidia bacterium]
MALKQIVLHVAGSSRGNPGPAALGVVIADAEGGVLHEVAEPLGSATANVATYAAWARGLQLAVDFGPEEVIVHSDSELVYLQLKGEYKAKQPQLRRLRDQVRELFQQFDRVRVRRVPRAENRPAHQLARQALAGEAEPEGRTAEALE